LKSEPGSPEKFWLFRWSLSGDGASLSLFQERPAKNGIHSCLDSEYGKFITELRKRNTKKNLACFMAMDFIPRKALIGKRQKTLTKEEQWDQLYWLYAKESQLLASKSQPILTTL